MALRFCEGGWFVCLDYVGDYLFKLADTALHKIPEINTDYTNCTEHWNICLCDEID